MQATRNIPLLIVGVTYALLMATVLAAACTSSPVMAAPAKRKVLSCTLGPATRDFGGSYWLVYGCDDGKSVVVVTAPGNPGAPFYFTFTFNGESMWLRGEGVGSKKVTDAAFKVLESMSQADVVRLYQQAKAHAAPVAEIARAVARVRAARTLDKAGEAAEHLADLARASKGEDIPKPLVRKIMSLLDSPYDVVRYWAATALGGLGPSARIAIPKLESSLPKVDCVNGAITSAGGIRYALIQLGAKLPPTPTCRPVAG